MIQPQSEVVKGSNEEQIFLHVFVLLSIPITPAIIKAVYVGLIGFLGRDQSEATHLVHVHRTDIVLWTELPRDSSKVQKLPVGVHLENTEATKKEQKADFKSSDLCTV
jgi:hypothetical protein